MLVGNTRITDFAQIAPIIVPVNLATGANNGDWINMRDFHRCAIVVMAAVGTAANDITLTLQQATDNASGGVKALNFTRVDVKEAVDISGVGQFTEVTQSAGNTYTSGTNGESQLVYVLDFAHDDLDIENDFDHVRVNIAQAGAAKVGCAFAICYGPKFGVDPQLSVL